METVNNVQFNKIMDCIKNYLSDVTGLTVLKPAYYLALTNKSDYLEHFLEGFTFPLIVLGFKGIETPIASRINNEIQYKYIIQEGVIAVLNRNTTLDKACEDAIDCGEDLQMLLQQSMKDITGNYPEATKNLLLDDVYILIQTNEKKPGYAEAYNLDAEGKYYYSFVIPCKIQTWK